MVVQGNFSLRLINASTMKPLHEHSSSTGKTFVTLASNMDFLVELEAVPGFNNKRSIFYQTTVSNSATTGYKRRQRLDSVKEKPSIFRFDKSSTELYDSVAKEKVTVRVFEVTDNKNGKKHLETITMHCCVLPSVKRFSAERTTSLGSILAGNTAVAFTNHARGGCLLKKYTSLSQVCTRSGLLPAPSLVE